MNTNSNIEVAHSLRTASAAHQRATLGRLGLLALLAMGCSGGNAPEESSSSHWLECKHDVECVGVSSAVQCDGQYCVDAKSERVSVSGSSNIGTTTGDDAECDPFVNLEHKVESGTFVALARSQAGVTYYVDALSGADRLYLSQGTTLMPWVIDGSGQSDAEVTLSFHDGDVKWGLLLTPGNAPTMAKLVRDPDPSSKEPMSDDEETLTLLDEHALGDYELGPEVSRVVIEYDAQATTGEHLVVVRPENWSGYEDFRLFYGKDAKLVERVLSDVTRAHDGGSTSLQFSVDGHDAQAYFAVHLNPTDDGGVMLTKDPGTLTLGGQDSTLELLTDDTTTRDASYQCFGNPPNGWRESSRSATGGETDSTVDAATPAPQRGVTP
jgi:hypothetical protein